MTKTQVEVIYENIDTIWKEFIAASGLSVYDTLTHGEGGLTFLEKVVQSEAHLPSVGCGGRIWATGRPDRVPRGRLAS